MLAYAIAAARLSGIFERVVVSTDSARTAEIARHYGADVLGLRPPEMATATSPDIEFIILELGRLPKRYDCFAIVRPTSPFRAPDTIGRAWDRFLALSESHGIDSLRAIELCHEHPGKMWVVEGELMHPLLDQSQMEVPWYASQYAALPKVYVQNSSLEIAWARIVYENRSREGRVIAPLFTEGNEGFSIDYEQEWELAERMVARGDAELPESTCGPSRMRRCRRPSEPVRVAASRRRRDPGPAQQVGSGLGGVGEICDAAVVAGSDLERHRG